MNENGWRTLRLSEVKPIPSPCFDDVNGWLPLRHTLGVEAFGINAWLGRETGDEVIENGCVSGGTCESTIVTKANWPGLHRMASCRGDSTSSIAAVPRALTWSTR